MKKVELMYGNGCRYYKDCFNCPFDDCINGMMYESKVTVARALREKAHALYKQGATVKEVMDTLDASQVMAYRYRRSMA